MFKVQVQAVIEELEVLKEVQLLARPVQDQVSLVRGRKGPANQHSPQVREIISRKMVILPKSSVMMMNPTTSKENDDCAEEQHLVSEVHEALGEGPSVQRETNEMRKSTTCRSSTSGSRGTRSPQSSKKVRSSQWGSNISGHMVDRQQGAHGSKSKFRA